MKTTNYFNTFITVAEDCPLKQAEIPQSRNGEPTIASLQFELIERHPYRYTSDDVLFTVYARRNQIPASEMAEAREVFFSKGQACLRASPLPKRYGWGIHSNAAGQVALVPMGSADYKRMLKDESLQQVKAMRSKRA